MGRVAACEVRELGSAGPLLPFAQAFHARAGSWWLDSALPDARLGRYSFCGFDPYAIARVRGARVELEVRRPVRADLAPGSARLESDAFALLSALLPHPPARDPAPELPFVGGAVGWLGYELAAARQP